MKPCASKGLLGGQVSGKSNPIRKQVGATECEDGDVDDPWSSNF